jgi:uncharacterized damage-inducible protein DinB
MTPEYFRTVFDYNYWARDRLLAQVSHLSEEEYQRPNGFTYGSIRGILVHCLSGEWGWLSLWQDRIAPAALLSPDDIPTIAALISRWAVEEGKMRSFLEQVTPERLRARLDYAGTDGTRWSRPLWQLMAHLVNHSTSHRSEAAEALTMIGHSPGDLDMIAYIRELSPPV